MSAKREYLGVDTSNYTTSVALYTDGEMISRRRLLPVKEGNRGLRQSDAVFLHTKQFPELYRSLPAFHPAAVGVSTRPRNVEDSYMPCFLTGQAYAEVLSHSFGCPLYAFSHQQGHIAAGVWSANREDLLRKPFLAFHVSGGTTELLLVNRIDDIRLLGHTLDLHAGQLIDRVGVMLGYPFPCGAHMDAALGSDHVPLRQPVRLKDGCCSLSGLENKAKKLFSEGAPKEEVAFFAINSVHAQLQAMIETALLSYPELPLLMIGGVCSNSLIRADFSKRYGAVFAENGFSCDNAAGIAFLAKLRHEGVL